MQIHTKAIFLAACLALSAAKIAPFSTATPTHQATTHPFAPSNLWADKTAPLETNAWYENFVLGQGSNQVNLYPYLVQATAQGLNVCG